MENKPIPPRRPGMRPVGKPIIVKPRPKPVDPAKTEKPKPVNPAPEPKTISKPVEPVKTPDPKPVFSEETPVKSTPPVNTPIKPTVPYEPIRQTSDSNTPPPKVPRQRSTERVQPERSGSDPLKTILIITNILFLAACAYLLFDKIRRENRMEDQIGAAKKETNYYKNDIDRKVAEIDRLQDSIRAVIAEKEALGQELATERTKLAELETLKGQLQSKQLSINSLNSKLTKYKRDYENAQLSMENISVNSKQLIDSLSKQLAAKEDSLRVLSHVKSTLSQKVAMASGLRAENISFNVLNTAGKEVKQAPSYRAMTVGNVKISLALAENQVTDPGTKEVYMRFIEPSGATLLDGEKNFVVNGKNISYTAMQAVEYNNKQQNISFEYKKPGRYTPGRYTVEFYSDGAKIGTGHLVLTK